LGLRTAQLPIKELPIAARSLADLRRLSNVEIYRIGRFYPANAIVIKWNGHWLLYVRPTYGGYRSVARRFFQDVPWKVDFDHSLGSCIAASHSVSYILLVRLPPKVNRSHGRHERTTVTRPMSNSGLYFADQRILSKIVGRPSGRSGRTGHLRAYDPWNPSSLGFTLKQRGQWAHALGIENHTRSIVGLTGF
jgi:hypothetical protein